MIIPELYSAYNQDLVILFFVTYCPSLFSIPALKIVFFYFSYDKNLHSFVN